MIGPGVAALAAERGGPALSAILTDTLDALAATDDDVERQIHALTFWDQVVDAADSLTFRLMFNSLRAAYEPALEALAPVMSEEVGQVGAYRRAHRRHRRGRPRHRPRRGRARAATGHRAPAHRPRCPQGDAMTKASPEIETLAAERLAADEERITGLAGVPTRPWPGPGARSGGTPRRT